MEPNLANGSTKKAIDSVPHIVELSTSDEQDGQDYHHQKNLKRTIKKRSVSTRSTRPNAQKSSDVNMNASRARKKDTRKRYRRGRTPTYTLRREETKQLEQQLQDLLTQQQAITFQSLLTHEKQTRNAEGLAANEELLRVIQQQQSQITGLQDLLSSYTQQHLLHMTPIQTFIRLEKNPVLRRNTLMQLRDQKLRDAKTFILKRSRSIDRTMLYRELDSFETPEGSFYTVYFSSIPIRGFRSVRAVFDAVVFRAFNLEIVLTETTGRTTVREDDDSNTDATVFHHRLASTYSHGVECEGNGVLFFGYYDENEGGEPAHAVIAGDFIDDDALYPYKPHERIRRDKNSAMIMTSFTEKQPGAEQDEVVVVITSWAITKLHRAEINVQEEAIEEIRDEMIRLQGVLLKNLRRDFGET